MHMIELIEKKKRGQALSDAEISYIVRGAADGSIPDYQLAAFLMAVCFTGMTDGETACFTACMAHSGETVDLSGVGGVKADKHSTGGIGDKTTLIACPLVAAADCGVRVAKLSGRGLGFTGGTIDKLESIPGLRTDLPADAFVGIVNRVGVCVAGQTKSLVPADKRLYALRDVTATVDSAPLIAASVMSKKIAGGSDVIVLDVKYGAGAFMKTAAEAEALAVRMADIGRRLGRRVSALITDMNAPLGRAVGNALEVQEACAVLAGRAGGPLAELSAAIAAEMLCAAGVGSPSACADRSAAALRSGRGLEKLAEMVEAQGGDPAYIREPERFPQSRVRRTLYAPADGWVESTDALAIGQAACALGAGRRSKDALIDHAAGILLAKVRGEYVRRGEALATLFADSDGRLDDAEALLTDAFRLQPQKPPETTTIYKIIH